MSRKPLPDTRPNWTQKVHIGSNGFYLCCDEYPDGTPGGIAVEAHKTGTFSRGILNVLSEVASLCLQHGVPLDALVRTLGKHNFPPNGQVLGSSVVKEATSVPDWIAQELEAVYLISPRVEKSYGYISPPWRIGV